MKFLKRYFPNNKVLILLIAIMIMGSILRFYGLEKQSLWTDELHTWIITCQNDLTDVIHSVVSGAPYPPGYYVFLYPVTRYLGHSEAALRFPSACFGIATILAIFFVGLRMYSHKEGLIASALMAILYSPVYYAQEARSYSMLIFFTLVATYFWTLLLWALEENKLPSKKAVLTYVGCAIVSCYLHYFGAYLVVLQAIGLIIEIGRTRHGLRYAFILYLPIAGSFLPWLPALWGHLHMPSKTPQLTVAFFAKYLGSIFNAGKSALESLSSYTKVDIAVSVGIISAVGLLYCYLFTRWCLGRMKHKHEKDFDVKTSFLDAILFLWLVVPFLGIYVMSLFSFGYFRYKYLLISLPAAYLLFARAINSLPFSNIKKAIGVGVICILALTQLIFYHGYYSKPQKEQYREAVQYVMDQEGLREDAIVIGNSFYEGKFFNYYFERLGSDRRIDIEGGREEDIKAVKERIRGRQPRHIWFISAHRPRDAVFMEYLKENLAEVDYKEFAGFCSRGEGCLAVWLFRDRHLGGRAFGK